MINTGLGLTANTWIPWQPQELVIGVASTADLLVIGIVLSLGFSIELNNDSRNLTPVVTTTITNTSTIITVHKSFERVQHMKR
jgi:hypothetical protein